MPDYKQVLGVITIAIGIAAYIPYITDLLKGKTKPHAFSWFIWGTLTAIGFFAQMSRGAGAGAWISIFTGTISFFIAAYALFKGERNITRTDWLSLFGAACALGLWAVTSEPLLAIILILATDLLGFYPTWRKSYHKPYEETLISYLLNGIKFIPALFALTSFNLTTALYPSYLIAANFAFVALVWWRRKQLSR